MLTVEGEILRQLELDPNLESQVHDAADHRLDRALRGRERDRDVVGAHQPTVDPADRAQELHHEVGRRPVVHVAGRTHLLDPPGVHHRDRVRDLHRLLLVVGNEDRGHAVLVVEAAKPPSQLAADVRVERPERLVEQQHARLNRERPRQRHPLALSA